jgi:olefin beta-lactone synthetase
MVTIQDIEIPARINYAAYGNIAGRLTEAAAKTPFQRAVVFPTGRDAAGRVTYSQLTFQQLDRESDRLARGLQRLGVKPGTRMVLMVRPSLEFIALTFALFKSAAVIVLIDPGMGRSNIVDCLTEVEPEGFVAIPAVHAVRTLLRPRFRAARLNVTVGKRWFWGGPNYADLLGEEWTPFDIPPTNATDSAAVIFTSGSTGPPKGVLYEHGMFNAQVDLLREFYGIQPGEIDLPGFPLFALFNAAMNVTTVIPEMDPTRPALVDPAKIIEAINDQGVTQAFGSPALWNRVGRYCEERAMTLPTLRRALSAGAPVPNHVLLRMRSAMHGAACGLASGDRLSRKRHDQPDIHTPYGATESLPVCSISGREVLEEIAALTAAGSGTCVGRPFPHVEVRIIEITEGPIASLEHVAEFARIPKALGSEDRNSGEFRDGHVGEIIVQAPSTTREYFRRPDATAAAKIPDGDLFWHRMGDVGYVDETGRLWFCGRKDHIVETERGRMFSVCCEAIVNEHPDVYRSALVGVGSKPRQRPVIVVEPEAGRFPRSVAVRQSFLRELRELAAASPLTESIDTFLFHRSLPVDTRHNVKIKRELLAPWAERHLS